MLLRLDRHVARVARVRLARDRVEHRAHQRERRRLVERVQDSRGQIGQQQHVGLVDLLEAADRRAVEADAIGERLLVKARERHPHVLPGPRQVGELEIDHARAVALGEGEHIARLRAPLAHQRTDAERLGDLATHEVRNHHSVLLQSHAGRADSRAFSCRVLGPRVQRFLARVRRDALSATGSGHREITPTSPGCRFAGRESSTPVHQPAATRHLGLRRPSHF